MQHPSLSTLMMGLIALAGSTSAVQLASFIPRIDRLSASCSIVYNAQIDGCVPDDFKPGATCSAACVRGLSRLTDGVKRACAGDDPGETSIIGVFQAGLGIGALCPSVAVVTSSSSPAPQPTNTKPPVPPRESTSATTTEVSASTGIITDPNATNVAPPPPGPPPPPPNGNPAAPLPPPPPNNNNQDNAPAPTANSQLSNSDSGGGSPFDVVATGSALQSRSIHVTVATLVASAVLFAMCA